MNKTTRKPAASDEVAETQEPTPIETTAPQPGQATPAEPKGKLGTLAALLRRSEGATLQAMTSATGWQAHSVRGAMAGALKKKLGLAIVSEKSEAGRVWRIVEAAA